MKKRTIIQWNNLHNIYALKNIQPLNQVAHTHEYSKFLYVGTVAYSLYDHHYLTPKKPTPLQINKGRQIIFDHHDLHLSMSGVHFVYLDDIIGNVSKVDEG